MQRWPDSGLLQRPGRDDVPLSAMDAAGRSLVPGLAAIPDAADDEITAGGAVFFVDGGGRGDGPTRDRGDGPTRTRSRVLPGLARAGLAASEHLAQRGFGDRPIRRRPGTLAARRGL